MSHDSAQAIHRLARAADEARAAADEARAAAAELLWSRRDAHHDDLYRAGAALTALTGALEQLTGHLADAARHYTDHCVVRDDENAQPEIRLAAAAAYLDRARAGYAAAGRAIAAYHNAIGHIGTEAPE